MGSKNFIYEPFSSDAMSPGSNIKAVYEKENKDLFKKFGVEKVQNKQPLGAESLFPKMGFALTLAIPYFQGAKPMTELDKTGYTGKPLQRYLKIAWAHSKDNKQDVAVKQKAKQPVSPKMANLATVHAAVEAQLDTFITSLAVDGFLGDKFAKKKNAALLPHLATFADAFTEAMVEMAATEPSSRLSEDERKRLAGANSTAKDVKSDLFANWRNFLFEDNVKAATKRGVRYAGMGQNHLDHLVHIGLDAGQHPFEMDGKDITAFKSLTTKLKGAAKKP